MRSILGLRYSKYMDNGSLAPMKTLEIGTMTRNPSYTHSITLTQVPAAGKSYELVVLTFDACHPDSTPIH